MGNDVAPPMEDDKLEGQLIFQSIEFRKLWTGEDKYQLSKLLFKTSNDISINFYYHDLLGIADKAPFFGNRSIITSCDFTRQYGRNHIFRGIWEGNMKPVDTIRYTQSLTKEVTVHVSNEADVGSYIRDETKCDKFMKIKNSFMSGDKLRDNGNGKLHLEVTLHKYRRSKGENTEWAIYPLIIPQKAIVSALQNAVIAGKPQIVEKFAKVQDKQNTKQASISFNDASVSFLKQIDILKQKLNDDEKERRESEQVVRNKMSVLKDEIKKLRDENDRLRKENMEFRNKHYVLHIKDMKNYRNWNSDTITEWILSLEPKPGAFKEYENDLRNKLREEAVNGSHLAALSTTDLDRFGIKSFGDKQIVLDNIKTLTSQNESHSNYSNEGKNDTSLM